MAERRRYTKAQKMTAVIAAEFSTPEAAANQLGIPHSNVYYWFNAPEFVELRKKTREDMAEETSAFFIENVPPNPQQRSTLARVARSRPRTLAISL